VPENILPPPDDSPQSHFCSVAPFLKEMPGSCLSRKNPEIWQTSDYGITTFNMQTYATKESSIKFGNGKFIAVHGLA
jgi:hypothetical protein